MEDSPQPEKVRIRRLLWLPFLICHTVVIGSQILTYRGHAGDGLWLGILYSVGLLPFWAAVLLWAFAVRIIHSWRNKGSHWKYWILAPAVCLCLWVVWQISLFPPTAAGVFHRLLAVRLPGNAADLRWEAGGGGFEATHGAYVFTAPPSEIERLIRELDLVPQEAKKWTLQDQKGKFRLADFAVGETVSHWGRIAGDEYSVEFVHLFHSPARGGVFIYVLTRGALAAERAK